MKRKKNKNGKRNIKQVDLNARIVDYGWLLIVTWELLTVITAIFVYGLSMSIGRKEIVRPIATEA